jgi:DNA-binding NarL/FixJ family response regulator
MTEEIRVVIVDDQELVRAGLRPLAERDGDITVVAEATQAIVADDALNRVRVLMLTTFDEDENVFAAIRAGAAGYLLKDVSPDDLRSAIRTVAAGDALLSPSVTAAVMRAVAEGHFSDPDGHGLDELTEREVEVLSGIGRGLTNDEIAAELFLSPATARTYVSRLLTRLDARDRAALIVLAYETGLVRPGGGAPH